MKNREKRMRIANRLSLVSLVLASMILSISSCKKDELTQEEKMQIYLDSHNIDAEPTESGMYYIEYIKGNGDFAVDLDTVEVTYTGRFLSENLFDANTIEFTVGVGDVIKGWDEGVKYMREGGKALLVIPSWLGYGEYGYSGIPGNTVLIFELDLNKITPGPNHPAKK